MADLDSSILSKCLPEQASTAQYPGITRGSPSQTAQRRSSCPGTHPWPGPAHGHTPPAEAQGSYGHFCCFGPVPCPKQTAAAAPSDYQRPWVNRQHAMRVTNSGQDSGLRRQGDRRKVQSCGQQSTDLDRQPREPRPRQQGWRLAWRHL